LKLRDVSYPPRFDFPIPTDSSTIERGQHIAQTRGCFGCHGRQLQGEASSGASGWLKNRSVAPNLAAHAKQYDAAVLEAAIRHGIGQDGRGFWSMPAYNWTHLTDADLAALIAFLRSAPVVSADLPSPRLGLRERWLIATGSEDHMAGWALAVPPLRSDVADPQLGRGEYLAMTTCNECHGLDLRGGFVNPDLAVVASYTEADFRRLMSEGVGIGGRDSLGLMTEVAKGRFAHFTDQEVEDLYAFLSKLVVEPVPGGVFWR